jgi:hypothetical protein
MTVNNTQYCRKKQFLFFLSHKTTSRELIYDYFENLIKHHKHCLSILEIFVILNLVVRIVTSVVQGVRITDWYLDSRYSVSTHSSLCPLHWATCNDA